MQLVLEVEAEEVLEVITVEVEVMEEQQEGQTGLALQEKLR